MSDLSTVTLETRGTWKIQARENVAAWLREKLGAAPVVLA